MGKHFNFTALWYDFYTIYPFCCAIAGGSEREHGDEGGGLLSFVTPMLIVIYP